MTCAEKLKAQAHGVKYGCHVDLEECQSPDGCVKDYGVDSDCVFAKHHRTREGCKYWKPVIKTQARQLNFQNVSSKETLFFPHKKHVKD